MNSNEWELGVVLRFKGSRDNDLQVGEIKFGVRSTRAELRQSPFLAERQASDAKKYAAAVNLHFADTFRLRLGELS